MYAFHKNKGFTLAELLIVVAIIAVLTAIAVPVFNSQLEKAREGTDLANIRSAYAEVLTDVLTKDSFEDKNVFLTQQVEGWTESSRGEETLNSLGFVTGTPKKEGNCVVSYDTDKQIVTFTFDGTSSGGGVIDPNNPNNYQYNGVSQVASSMTSAVQQALHDILGTDGSYVSHGYNCMVGSDETVTAYNLDSIKRNDNGTYGGKTFYINKVPYSFSEYIDKQLHFDTSKVENVSFKNLFVYVDKNGNVPYYSYTDDTKQITSFYTADGEYIDSVPSQSDFKDVKIKFVNDLLDLPGES